MLHELAETQGLNTTAFVNDTQPLVESQTVDFSENFTDTIRIGDTIEFVPSDLNESPGQTDSKSSSPSDLMSDSQLSTDSSVFGPSQSGDAEIEMESEEALESLAAAKTARSRGSPELSLASMIMGCGLLVCVGVAFCIRVGGLEARIIGARTWQPCNEGVQ
jgi:hypothetical protein